MQILAATLSLRMTVSCESEKVKGYGKLQRRLIVIVELPIANSPIGTFFCRGTYLECTFRTARNPTVDWPVHIAP
jgi:hypothetical protein